MAKYVIALCIRLSIEDTKVESMSIESQRALLHKYAENLEDDIEIIEYIDNGHTGLNFERPAVQELLNDVQNHKVNCIIVKDFSRFGRNSIEVGYFTQQIFPLYKVRFISIADRFDSDEHKGDTGGMEVAFKYLVNEYYSRDLSVKSKTAKYTKMRRGEYYSNNYPYGYLSDENRKPIIDEAVADVVRMIFDLTIQGKSAQDIAKILYGKNIASPAMYKAARGKTGYNISKCKTWDRSAVLHILDNEMYMGMFVMCKKTVQDVGSTKMINRDKSEWITIPNHYPAIVSEEVFRKANEVRRRFTVPHRSIHTYPLRGKVVCGCCDHHMHYLKRIKPVYICKYTSYDENEPCYKSEILVDDLQNMLFDIVFKKAKEILRTKNDTAVNPVDRNNDIAKKIDECQQKKQRLYEILVSGDITVDEFKALKEQCNAEIQNYEQQNIISLKSKEQAQAADTSRKTLIQIAKDVLKENTLTQALTDTLIENVFVYPDKSIKVEWKVKDFG